MTQEGLNRLTAKASRGLGLNRDEVLRQGQDFGASTANGLVLRSRSPLRMTVTQQENLW
jgi:hypothetical protein